MTMMMIMMPITAVQKLTKINIFTMAWVNDGVKNGVMVGIILGGGWMGGRVDGWMGGRTDGWMGGWVIMVSMLEAAI